MWQPEPGWQPLPGGLGPSTAGVWRATIRGRQVAVKRLVPPSDVHDEPGLDDPTHFAYWRRAAEVAASGLVASTPGLHAPRTVSVDEDDEGITLVTAWVDFQPVNGLFAARSLGLFGGADLTEQPWFARDQLRARLLRTEQRGGWPTLQRTPVADVADHLWRHRLERLDELDALPRVAQHGDPSRGNLVAVDGSAVVTVDWGSLGLGPVGGDLGYLALSAREELGPLVDAYVGGLPPGLATRDQVLAGARVTAVYTSLSRAEWALAKAAPGEGALAGKFSHPSVAPYLFALQRLYPQLEALL
ncbi:phosphotransferase [Nocardioides bigeumensis]|uniref:Aminoglycoside phosphotransferase domain-containing protein n=1 Tax=Nocardioides bigeumensis TaxID=433657 RepID=A0ABN2XYH1_9ACTN